MRRLKNGKVRRWEFINHGGDGNYVSVVDEFPIEIPARLFE